MSTPGPGAGPPAPDGTASPVLSPLDGSVLDGGNAPPRRPHAAAVFWLTAAAGWAVIGYGLRGMLHHHIDTRPANLAKFAVGGALIHDLLFAPLVLAAGVVVSRAVPAALKAIAQAALIVSGSLVLFSYPLVRGFAHAHHNPSSLPHNYTANLGIVLAAVWAIASAAAVLHLRRSRRS
jgi:hypothetical protein